MTAWRPDPQRRSTCMPGTVTGRPESSAINASDRRCLAVGIAVAKNYILYRFGRNAAAFEQPGERGLLRAQQRSCDLNIPP